MNVRCSILVTFFTSMLLTFSAQAEMFRTVIVNEVVIDRTIEDVFQYATTADNWHEWHPNTRYAEGASDHSATEGEEIIEHVKVGFVGAGRLLWQVTRHIEPNQWQITGRDELGLSLLIISYTFTVTEDGMTHFRRELVYDLPKSIFSQFNNFFFLKPYMKYMSTKGLRQFRQILEQA